MLTVHSKVMTAIFVQPLIDTIVRDIMASCVALATMIEEKSELGSALNVEVTPKMKLLRSSSRCGSLF